MKTQNKKENLITFNEIGFKRDVENKKKKVDLFVEVLDSIKKYKEVSKDEYSELRNNPIAFIEKSILESYEDINTMKLSFNKLVDVLEIKTEIDPIKELALKYKAIDVDETKEIVKDNYCIYAKTPEQLKRLKTSRNLIDSLNEMKKLNNNLSFPRINQTLNRMLNLKSSIELEINPTFVLDGRIV